MIGYWSQDTGLLSNKITKIDKGKKWTKIITNVVLPGGWGIAVCWTISISDSGETETRDMKDKNNIGGSIPQSNHIFLI